MTNVLCNGGATGAIDLTVNGGASPFTYDWSNNGAQNPDTDPQDLAGLTAGTYTVTVTAADGCTATTSATVAQPAVISITKVTTNITCNGAATGAIDISVSGGTSPYTYDWSNDGPENPDNDPQDLTGVVASVYTVTVTDANGCTATNSTTLTQPGAIVLTFSTTSASCGNANGSINLSASGGTGPLTFDWSNDGPEDPDNDPEDLTGLTAGTYTVTVTSATGCSSTNSATVTQQSQIVLTIVESTSTCGGNGSLIDLSVSGGDPGYTYQWSSGQTTQDLTNMPAGTYTVTVTDEDNCTATGSVTAQGSSQGQCPPPGFPTPGNTCVLAPLLCESLDGYCTVTGGVGTLTFVWSSGHSTEDLNNVPAGVYTVTVTDANGCTATTSATVTEPAILTLSAESNPVLCNSSVNGNINLTVIGGVPSYSYIWSNGFTGEDPNGLGPMPRMGNLGRYVQRTQSGGEHGLWRTRCPRPGWKL